MSQTQAEREAEERATRRANAEAGNPDMDFAHEFADLIDATDGTASGGEDDDGNDTGNSGDNGSNSGSNDGGNNDGGNDDRNPSNFINGVYYTNDELVQMGLRSPDSPDGVDADYAANPDSHRQSPERAAEIQQDMDRRLATARAEVEAGTRDAADLEFYEMAAKDAVSWHRQLIEGSGNSSFDESDFEGVLRNLSYAKNRGQDPLDYIKAGQEQNRKQAASGGAREGREGYDPSNPGYTSGGPGAFTNAFSNLGGGGGTTGSMSNYGTTGSGYQPHGAFTAREIPDDLWDKWPKTFTAPDPAKLDENPLVKARLRIGNDAIEKSNAARGTFFTPGMLKEISTYSGDVASSEYNNIYNRAFGEFQNAYGQFQGDRSRRAGLAGQQFGQDLSAYGTNYGVSRDNQTIPFGWNVQGRQLDQGDRSLGQADYRLGQTDRSIALGAQGQAWSQNRQGYMDQYGIWRDQDDRYWDRLFKGSEGGAPTG